MALWTYNANTKRYRVTAEGAAATGQKPGTFVSQAKQATLRDVQINDYKRATDVLAQRLFDKEISIQQWQAGMRDVVKTSMGNEYALAKGGRNAMTQADWGRVGQMTKNQYAYLQRFSQDIANGRYSTAEAIAARARMYPESSSQAFERANVLSRGIPDLPQYPGDGNTQCLSNCKCHWVIKETDTTWECTWKLRPAEHCPDCLALAEQYAPLVIPKRRASTRSALMGQLESVSAHEH